MSAGPVVLVGLMGSGKTTVGRRLAKRLDRPFVDADEVVAERAGRTITEIFAADGEAAFRAMERDVLREVLSAGPVVIATGGGAVIDPANRAELRRPGATVVWLDASPAFLASRAAARPHRPLLSGLDDPRVVLEQLHDERAGWYAEVADIRVDVEPFHAAHDKPKRALADRLAELVRDHERAMAVPG